MKDLERSDERYGIWVMGNWSKMGVIGNWSKMENL